VAANSTLWVATRKGLFGIEHGRIAYTAFVGDPVTIVTVDSRDGAVYAALKLGHFGVKLHRSDDGGRTFAEIAVPAYPAQADAAKAGPTLGMIWALEPGGAAEPGVLWAGTIPGALFRSADRGSSWARVESLWDRPERAKWFGGGADEPGIHSIAVHPHDARRVIVAVSCGGVWSTADGGASWQNRSAGMRANYVPPAQAMDPDIQDPHRLVRCSAAPDVLWVQHHNGIFRTTDEGRTWTEIPADRVSPSTFGFAVAVHPKDPNRAWFVPAADDEKRIPVGGRVVCTRTVDGGRSFETIDRGLPREHAYHLVYRHALDIDATGARLAFGSTTGGLWESVDQGSSWTSLFPHLPPIYAVRYA